MGMKLEQWTAEQAKIELNKRLTFCKLQRRSLEADWQKAETAIFNTQGLGSLGGATVSYDNVVQYSTPDIDGSLANSATNRVFKNLRFIHSQMSANPPTVIPRPSSNDLEDRRAADAADRIVRFSLRKYNMQEKSDIRNFYTLLHGTGVMKKIWDVNAGEIADFDEMTNEVTMEGDFSIYPINTWNFWMDADATSWDEVKYIFEEILLPYEQACFMFGSSVEVLKILEENRIQESDASVKKREDARSLLKQAKYDVVRLYQYWEKGMPYNGMQGRFCWCTVDGSLVTPVGPNPARFAPPQKKNQLKRLPGVAELPYSVLTDIDVPGTPWGKSVIPYVSEIQDNINRLDTSTLDAIQAHGAVRMVLPEGTEIADDSITNSNWDVMKVTGNQPPFFAQPFNLPVAVDKIRAIWEKEIDDTMGVNESMFGQQSREQSGLSMQYATNQGNMVRRRLFNKYVLAVESDYKSVLKNVNKYWDETRTIQVLGKEKAFELMDIKGSDVEGGFDLVVEYGASLSLDPVSRREEIITLLPLFEKAGVPTRSILGMMKLNELEGMYDRLQMASDRQREIFEEMIANQVYIKPRELADHANMLAYCYDYIMTTEYKYLKEEDKVLIDAHIKAREMEAAKGASAQAGQQAAESAQASPAGGGGPLPVGAGMTGQQAEAGQGLVPQVA